ncbi:glutamyl-tRNA reductase [bacterium]|nr:glutamyl-tRNA reductase [bacterium]
MSADKKKPNIFNLGVSYKSADVSLRESLFVPEDSLSKILPEIKSKFDLEEISVISTCNRFEMFGVTFGRTVSDEDLIKLFLSIQGEKDINPAELKASAYIYRDETAVHHLISVTSSLDSLVVGETQITGQFKKSIALSKEAGTLGSILDRLSQEALSCSKKIRRNTAIGEKTVSISHAAIDLAKKIFGDISEQKVLIIGAGEMSRLAFKYAASYSPASLMVANRTIERAQKLVDEVGYGSSHGMDELANLLEEADIVISSTSATDFVLTHSLLSNVRKSGKNTKTSSMFLCDIAVPRDIDPRCRELDEIFLFEVDDLQQVVNENIEERKLAANDAKTYVESATKHFMDWISSHDLKPILASVKKSFDELLLKESSKTLKRDIFSNLESSQKDALAALHEAISSKMLAKVAIAIGKEKDDSAKYALIHAVKQLYLSDEKQK